MKIMLFEDVDKLAMVPGMIQYPYPTQYVSISFLLAEFKAMAVIRNDDSQGSPWVVYSASCTHSVKNYVQRLATGDDDDCHSWHYLTDEI